MQFLLNLIFLKTITFSNLKAFAIGGAEDLPIGKIFGSKNQKKEANYY